MNTPHRGIKIALLVTLAGMVTAVAMLTAFLVVRGVARLGERQGERDHVVRIVAGYQGASPEVVEETVTVPLELALQGVVGVRAIRSQSSEGTSDIRIDFEPKRDIYLAVQDVQMAISTALPQLPASTDPPIITKRDPDELPVVWLALHGDRSLVELSALAERVRDGLLRVPGIGGVELAGTRRAALHVHLDSDRMAALGLTTSDVVEALRKQGLDPAAGNIGQPPGQPFGLRVAGRLRATEELGQVVVAAHGVRVVLLRDVGNVEVGVGGSKGACRFAGLPAVGLGVAAVAAGTPADVARRVREELPQLRLLLPEGVTLEVASDHSASRGLLVEVALPAGASIERMEEAARRAAEAVAKQPGVSGTLTLVEERGGQAVLLVQGGSGAAGQVRQTLAQFPELRGRVLDLSKQGLPPRRRWPVEVVLQGEALDELGRWARLVEERLAGEALVSDAASDYREGVPQVQVVPNRQKAEALGVSMRDMAEAGQTVMGGVPFGEPRDGWVQVWLLAGDRRTVQALRELRVRAAGGQIVPLGAVAQVREVTSTPAIRRFNHERAVTITANPAGGATAKAATERVLAVAEQTRIELGLSDAYRAMRNDMPVTNH